MSKIEIDLNTNPDEYGFLHGEVRQGDRVMPYRVMPPIHLWKGQEMHPNCAPFDTALHVKTFFFRGETERYRDTNGRYMRYFWGKGRPFASHDACVPNQQI